MRLLFISHLFPDGNDPWRGLENVAMLQTLANRWEIRAAVLRPVGAWSKHAGWHPRAADVAFRPEFVATSTLPLVGTRWNAPPRGPCAPQAPRPSPAGLAIRRRPRRYAAPGCLRGFAAGG